MPELSEDLHDHASSSLENPDYWWYRARVELLHAGLGEFLGTPDRVLDVGSADGPSVGWMAGFGRQVSLDINPQGLTPGAGVCGSVLALPFADETFDVVGAFDVVEHCEPEDRALAELFRVIRPGGRLLMSVPAYQWAWSDLDVRAGHHRRYTRRRLRAAVENASFEVRRVTYGFAGVFPFFAAERLKRKLRSAAPADQLTPVPKSVENLLMAACKFDRRLLRRGVNLPFGSSVFLAATKPSNPAQTWSL